METNHLGEKDPLRHLHGVGFDEPKDALRKYTAVFKKLIEEWRGQPCPVVTPGTVEACRAFKALYYSIRNEPYTLEELTKESAKLWVLSFQFGGDLGL
jgi:hypothetical protein